MFLCSFAQVIIETKTIYFDESENFIKHLKLKCYLLKNSSFLNVCYCECMEWDWLLCLSCFVFIYAFGQIYPLFHNLYNWLLLYYFDNLGNCYLLFAQLLHCLCRVFTHRNFQLFSFGLMVLELVPFQLLRSLAFAFHYFYFFYLRRASSFSIIFYHLNDFLYYFEKRSLYYYYSTFYQFVNYNFIFILTNFWISNFIIFLL